METPTYTYLAGCDVTVAMDNALANALPALEVSLFPTPHLMSTKESAQGKGNPHLSDDLSTRICVAYRALRSAGLRHARRRIAEMLNRHGLRTRGWGKISKALGVLRGARLGQANRTRAEAALRGSLEEAHRRRKASPAGQRLDSVVQALLELGKTTSGDEFRRGR